MARLGEAATSLLAGTLADNGDMAAGGCRRSIATCKTPGSCTAAGRARGPLVLPRWCFVDAAHFSRLFRQHFGYPPSQARLY